MKRDKKRNKVHKKRRPSICVPLVSGTEQALIEEVGLIKTLPCELVEWRADYFLQNLEREAIWQKAEKTLDVLSRLRLELSVPIIFTIRSIEEGGVSHLLTEDYYDINRMIVRSKLADYVDVELFDVNGTVDKRAIISFVEMAHNNDVRVILSCHEFEHTPSKEEMLGRLILMKTLNADIAKLAVMPRRQADVQALLEISTAMRDTYKDYPFIALSMGQLGMSTRICGGEFGSAVTFAAGKEASAPGQIDAVSMDTFLSQYY